MKYELSTISSVAKSLISEAGKQKVWCFVGEMGAGKTTLIKEVCRQLHVTDTLSSPTFSIVNAYRTDEGKEIYHFDFYRIEDPLELMQLGVEEYFDSGNICLVEWPDRAVDYLPAEYLKINVKLVSDNSRELTVNHV